jgi:hypothetical protein
VDDLNSDRTEAATLFNLRLGFEQKLGAWKLRESLHQGTVRFDGSIDAFMCAAEGPDFQTGVLRALEKPGL